MLTISIDAIMGKQRDDGARPPDPAASDDGKFRVRRQD